MRILNTGAVACYLVVLDTVLNLPGIVNAINPLVQNIYTADPAPLVHDGRVYLYTGHDEDNSTDFNMQDWHVFSSVDMANWQHHGSPMSLSTFSWAIARAWAGQAIERNGKFYWYVPVESVGKGMAIGVAVSDSPTGPFVDAIGEPLLANNEIDPTVFIDDDDQAYLYWGNPNLWYVKLSEDMISLSGEITKVEMSVDSFGGRTGNPDRSYIYEEGPWLYKRGGIYYMVFAAACCPENIQYSTGPSATGPWTYQGIIQPAEGRSFTNHVGIIDYKGISYYFYHDGALPGGSGFTRSVSLESFVYNADGTIPRIPMTKEGPAQLGTLNPFVRQEAETMAWGSGIETETSYQGGMDVTWINNKDYVQVIGVNFGTGAVSFTASVASARDGGTIELRIDAVDGPIIGTCTVPGTGGWQTWNNISCAVTGAAEVHDLFFVFYGADDYFLFNFDWWQFA